MTATQHPDPRVLTDYALGRLEEPNLESISVHVETCLECQETLSRLDASDDTLIRGIAGQADHDPFAEEDEREITAISAIRRMNPAPQGEQTCAPSGNSGAALQAQEALGTLRDYQLLAKLGEGGMGAVYRARHLRLDRLVAIKMLPTARLRERDALMRFHREMKAVGNLNHPHIVQAHDAGEVDGKHFLVMELVDGVDLAALVEREGPLRVADACELIRQAAIGLEHAHRHGLVHRDVKPSNLMLNRDGVVKLLDLGLARVLGEEHHEVERSASPARGPTHLRQSISGELTGADQIMGTPDFMAPEQLSDSRAVDGRSDVYSLGATLYKLISGSAPFSGPDYAALAKKLAALADRPAPPINERRDDVPAELQRVLERLLAKDPADRYASPAQLAAALEPFCAGHDVLQLAQTTPSLEEKSAVTETGRRGLTQPLHSTPATATAAGAGGGRIGRWLLAAAAAGCVAAAAVVVYLQTNNGTLAVRSRAPGEIEIEIVDENLVVRRKSITSGGTDITLPVGDYRVRVKGANGDRIVVDDDRVVIARGGTEVVTLKWTPKKTDSAAASPPIKPKPESTPAAGQDLRERYAALRREYRESMSADEFSALLKKHSPPLGLFPADGVRALLQFVTQLPSEAHQTLLEQGYVKFRYADLDWQRQAQLRRFLMRLLQAAPTDGDPASGTAEEQMPAMFLAADVGLVVLDDADSDRQVVALVQTTLASPLPIITAIAGDLGRSVDQAVQAAWQRQILTLSDRPYSALPQPLPSRFGAKFLPATHMPIAAEGVLKESVTGVEAWRIDADDSRTVRLFEVAPPALEDCVLTYRVQMRTGDVVGRAYLEMWCQVPGQEEASSRGFHHAVSGTNDWAVYETPFLLRKGQRPATIQLNLVIEGGGTVWIKEAELTASPTRPSDSNPRTSGD